MDKKNPPQLFADQPVRPVMSRANPKKPVEPQFENPTGFRAKPDAILNPAGEAGWFLERERVDRGLTLDDIADQTGIHPFHIEAIEHGDMTRMPARMEALELVAIYAHHLGFQPEPLIEHYASFLPAPGVAPKHHPADPAPLSSAKILPFGKIIPRLPRFDMSGVKLPNMGQLPGGNNIVAAIAGFLMIAGGSFWMFAGPPESKPAEVAGLEEIGPMPGEATSAQVAKVTITESPVTQEALASLEGAAKIVPDDPDAMGAFIDQLPEEAETTASVKPIKKGKKSKDKKEDVEVSSKGRVFGEEAETSRITLTAKAPVWVSIDDANGKPLMTQMLNPGDTYRVPDQQGLVVLTRDGGRLAFSIDGVEKGLLGTPGEIITGDPLNIDELMKKG